MLHYLFCILFYLKLFIVAEALDTPEDIITMDNGCVCCSVRGTQWIKLIWWLRKKNEKLKERLSTTFANIVETERSRAPLDQVLSLNSLKKESILSYDPNFFETQESGSTRRHQRGHQVLGNRWICCGNVPPIHIDPKVYFLFTDRGIPSLSFKGYMNEWTLTRPVIRCPIRYRALINSSLYTPAVVNVRPLN